MSTYLDRRIVGRWLRIKAHQREETADFRALLGVLYGYRDESYTVREHDHLRRLLAQLANDAEHSDLLWRLFNGEEPR